MKTEDEIESKINTALAKHKGELCILFCEQKKLFASISPDVIQESITQTINFSNQKLEDDSFSLQPNQTIIIDVTLPGVKIIIKNEFDIDTFPSVLLVHKSEIRDFVPFLYTTKHNPS